MKRLYYILILFSFTATPVCLTAQTYQSEYQFQSTNSYTTSYQLPQGDYQANVQFANGSVQTVASSLNGQVYSDEGGYINPSPTNAQRSIAPPAQAPLHLDLDALLFILLLATAYVIYHTRRSKTASI